ncbi:MAG: tetratricopeptide repeat protein [Rhodospirillaceae bacterium]|nr:tetratricopeptide repeat protein [Rhodospirillaceae bacterium]
MTNVSQLTSAAKILLRATAAHRSGRRDEAEPLYLEALRLEPNNAQARYQLGALHLEMQAIDRALEQLQQAHRLRPDHVPTQSALGVVLATLGRGEEAVRILEEVASVAPHEPSSFGNLGQAYLNLKRFDDAARNYKLLCELQPNNTASILGLAECWVGLGDKRRAIDVLEAGIGRIPDFFKAQFMLARLLLEIGDNDRAGQVLLTLLERRPNLPNALLMLGNLRYRQMQLGEAETYFRRLLLVAPDDPYANNYLGATLQNLGRIDDAERFIAKAHVVAPDDPEVLSNMGLIAQERGRFEDAIAFQRKAIAIKPTMAEAWNNLGIALQNVGSWDEALSSYRQAVNLKPDFAAAKSNVAHALLSLGQLAEGWSGYHFRFEKKHLASKRRQFDYPTWAGEPISSDTLLLWTDQGLGDEVLFASMIPDVTAQCGHCILECSPRLTALMQRSFPAVTVVPRMNPSHPLIAQSAPKYQISLGEIGSILRPSLQSIPRLQGYLRFDENVRNALRQKYEGIAAGRKIVGLSWKSENPFAGRAKSPPLSVWHAVLRQERALFVSVQYGDVAGDLAALDTGLANGILRDPGIKPNEDPDLSAAQIAALDLVITVSNTTAHFAGALNVPTWTLLPKGPGLFWYWFHERSDSPWYPSMTLFRQDAPGQWEGAMTRLSRSLAEWVAS